MKTNIGRSLNRIVAVMLAIAVASPCAYAADIGRVSYIEGRVDIARQGADAVTPLREGDLISIGDTIRTKSSSKAEVTFKDESVIRLAQNTKIEVRDYVLDGDNKRKTADILLERGKARTIIAKMSDKAEFNISTPNARGTVKGSDVIAFYQAGNSGMLVSEGLLSIANTLHPGEKFEVPQGSSIVVPQDGTPSKPRAYFELEKKLHEQETAIPETVSRRIAATMIKGFLSGVSGDVRITPKDTAASRKATVMDTIGEKDLIETGADGLAEIRFENGNGMNLKQNTKVLITKLAMDSKTGQYENRFEASMGKVRARIEKLKETDSTFEIKTPSAICGARGTLMYLEISPAGTRCFFEGGTGDLASAISSIHRQIEMGMAAFADNNGNVSDPYSPGDNERLDWTGSWETGNGTEGYTAPGNTMGFFLTDSGLVDRINVPATETELQNFFNEPLFDIDDDDDEDDDTDSDTGSDSDSDIDSETDVAESKGVFTSMTSYYDIWNNGGLKGEVELSDGTLWNGGSAELTSGGDYTSDGNEPFIWYGKPDDSVGGESIGTGTGTLGFLHSYDPDKGTNTTVDGGAFYGTTIGIGGSGILKGFAQLMYLDPDGVFGFASGDQEGLFSSSSGSYIFTGIVTGTEWTDNIGIDPVDMVDEVRLMNMQAEGVSGGFEGGGYLEGQLASGFRHYLNYESGSVGIFDLQMWGDSNVYYNYEDTSAGSLTVGGDNDPDGDHLYWLANSSGLWESNQITGKISGRSLSFTSLGQLDGNLYGVYRAIEGTFGNWMAAGAGRWTEQLLGWSALAEANYAYYYSEDEYIDTYGSQTGIVGALQSPLESPGTPVASVLMGVADSELPTWWGSLSGSYAYDGSDIPDGFIAGITDYSSETVKGMLISLYVDAYGNAGVLTGDFEGLHYTSLGMWEADGTLTATQKGFYAYNDYYLEYNNIQGYFEGSFEDSPGGYIYNDSNIWDISYGRLGSYTAWLVDEFGQAADWGIFNIELGGYYNNPGDTNESWKLYFTGSSWTNEEEMWFAKASGTKWSDDIFEGVLDGFYALTDTTIGIISGRVMGSIGVNEGDVWEGITLGTFEKKDLLWSADTGSFSAHHYDSYNGAIYNNEDGSYYIRMGTVASPFTSPGTPVNMYLVGETWGESNNTAWGYITGSYADESIIPEGFMGFSVSRDNEDTRGILAALYIDGAGNAGTLTGQFDGKYYWGDGIFSGFGTLTANQRSYGFTSDYGTDYNYIDGTLNGKFDQDGAIYNIADTGNGYYEDVRFYDSSYGLFGSYTSWLVNASDPNNPVVQNWGIYNIEHGGSFYRTYASDDWKLAMSGNSWRSESDYWFASVDGAKWSDSLVVGSMDGVWFESAATEMSPNAVKAGSIHGDMVGDYASDYIEVEGESGTWTAISAGEWVEVTELLDQTVMFGANGLSELNNFVNVPVTEVYSNILTAGAGACSGAITSAYANVNIFSVNNPSIMYDIFTMWGGGTLSGPMSLESAANLTHGAESNIVMQVTQVTPDNQFTASLSGVLNGQTIASGQVAGPFTTDSFSFVGGGTVPNDNAGAT